MAFNPNQQTEIKNLIRDMLKSEDESVLVKDLLKDTLKGGLLTKTLKDDFDIKQSPRLKAGEGGVQITDLPQVNQTGSGDLMLVRKTAQGQDNAITYDNFLNSIGNTAVSGFAATIDANNVNGIILSPVNGVTIPTYVNFMKVSFISPINSTGQVQIKIGTLPYKNLYALNTTTTAVIKVGDYVEAILVGTGVFNQTNNANYVYTNDYVVQTMVIDPSNQFTNIYLASAYGVLKTTYYIGMTINFTCPENTKGFVRIRIDGLPLIDLIGDIDSGIPFEIFATNMVQAVYNGISFVPNSFLTADPTVEIPIEPDQNNPNEVIVPIQNQLLFTVGTQGNPTFSNMQAAVSSLIKQYGKDGGGRKVTLSIISDIFMTYHEYNSNRLYLLDVPDLSWITLESPNNIINFTGESWTGSATNIWSFDKAFSFKSGTTFNIRNITGSNIFNFMSARKIVMNNITIDATSNNKINVCLTIGSSVWATDTNIFGKEELGSATLNNCNIKGGIYGIIVSSGDVTLDTCNINSTYAYQHAKGTGNILNCDLSVNGTSSSSNISIYNGVTINQKNSRAQSDLAPNTNNQNGTYWVIGDQNAVGKS